VCPGPQGSILLALKIYTYLSPRYDTWKSWKNNMNKCPIDLLSLLNTNDVCISNCVLYSWQANEYESRVLGPWSMMESNSTSETLKSQCIHTCFSLYSTCVFRVIYISHKLNYVPNWYFIIKCLKETRLFWYASNFRFKLSYGLISISKVVLKFPKWNTVVFKKGPKERNANWAEIHIDILHTWK